MRIACLALGLLVIGATGLSAKPREKYEWSRMWWNEANDESLPRVLLIGDSITEGYQGFVAEELRDVAHVGYWTSSKCVSDRSYLALLRYVLDEYPYAVIHFNNGLHSLDADRGEWVEGLRGAFRLLRERRNGAQVIWGTSTPLRPMELTAISAELNALAAPLVSEMGWPTDDLFGLMNHDDRATEWSDDFPFHEAARRRQAKQVADMIRDNLPAPAASAAPAE